MSNNTQHTVTASNLNDLLAQINSAGHALNQKYIAENVKSWKTYTLDIDGSEYQITHEGRGKWTARLNAVETSTTKTRDTMSATTTTTGRVWTKIELNVPTVTNEMRLAWSELNHEQLTAKLDWNYERRNELANAAVNPYKKPYERRESFAWLMFVDALIDELKIRCAHVGQREMDDEMGNG
jgi:hypothetical protein